MKHSVVWVAVFVVALAGAYFLGRTRAGNSESPSRSPPAYVGFEPAAIDLGDQLWDTLVPFELSFVNRGTG